MSFKEDNKDCKGSCKLFSHGNDKCFENIKK